MSILNLLSVLDAFIAGRSEFDSVRRFVFQYYEGEEDFEITGTLDQVFSVLAPYLEHEEAYGDEQKLDRMRRLRGMLEKTESCAERCVFALNFDRIRELRGKLSEGKMAGSVYLKQISKLSPATFDVRRVASWADAHGNAAQPDDELMSR